VKRLKKKAPGHGEWVLGGVLLAVLVGLAAVSQGYWRRGLSLIGLALVIAGVLRGLLPVRRVGLLAVRSRPFDTLLLLGAGIALVALVFSVPPRS
jgi:hypothetical protein